MKYAFFTLVLCASTAFAQDVSAPKKAAKEVQKVQTKLNMEKLEKLVVLREVMDEVKSLREKSFEVDEDGTLEETVLARASEAAGFPITSYEQLKSLTGAANPPPTAWERIKGFITFGNIIMVIAAIIGVVAFCALFGHYLLEAMKKVPLVVWEFISYAGCLGLIYAGTMVSPELMLMPVLPGVLGLIGCTVLTDKAHFGVSKSQRTGYSKVSNQWLQLIQWGFLAVAWGAVAFHYQSQIIGFMSVMAAMAAVGFVWGITSWGVYIGWDDEVWIAKGTTAAGLALATYIVLYITGTSNPYVDPFKVGLHFMGSFVFFLGILIMSSKHYCSDYTRGRRKENRLWGKFFLINALCLASGVGALYLGSVYGMGSLLGIGGTLFVLWIVEKYLELPWEGIGWAWCAFSLAIFAYFMVGQMKLHPEYFLGF